MDSDWLDGIMEEEWAREVEFYRRMAEQERQRAKVEEEEALAKAEETGAAVKEKYGLSSIPFSTSYGGGASQKEVEPEEPFMTEKEEEESLRAIERGIEDLPDE